MNSESNIKILKYFPTLISQMTVPKHFLQHLSIPESVDLVEQPLDVTFLLRPPQPIQYGSLEPLSAGAGTPTEV